MQSFNQIVTEFNSYIHQQKFFEALDRLYHSEVVSADNDEKQIVGIDRLRYQIKQFIDKAQIHKIELVSLHIEDKLSAANCCYSLDHKEFGRIEHHQFSVQRWKDNKIIQGHHFDVR